MLGVGGREKENGGERKTEKSEVKRKPGRETKETPVPCPLGLGASGSLVGVRDTALPGLRRPRCPAQWPSVLFHPSMQLQC